MLPSAARPLPRRLAAAADVLGLTPHIVRWASMADGRSNHAKTEVFLVALDVEPGVIALKLSGGAAPAREAIARERAALDTLRRADAAVPAPRRFDTPALGDGAIALEFLPGEPYERWLGRAHDAGPLAQDLATHLQTVWSVSPGKDLPDAPASAQLAAVLRGVIGPGVEAALDGFLGSDHTDTAVLVHGDLRPSNLLVRDEDGVPRLSGIIDWSMAARGSAADDQVAAECFLAPIHRDLPGLLRDALPPLDPAGRRRASVRLLCRLLDDTLRSRDWEAFRRNEQELAAVLEAEG